MSILALLERVRDHVNKPPHPFLDRESVIRRSYLTGIAMQAHADGKLSEGEQKLFLDLAHAFGIEEPDAREILLKAADPDEETVMTIRGHLLDSRFKYYFILDLQIMAHQDQHLSDIEHAVLTRFCDLLEVGAEDREFLIGLADAVVERDPEAKQSWAEGFFSAHRSEHKIEPEDLAHYTE